MDVAEVIKQFGFPIVAAAGLGYFVYYVWVWATKEVKPVVSEANTVLIALIDRIRMLDNDLIRLNQKLNTVLQLRGKVINAEREAHEERIDKKADDVEKDGLDPDDVKTASAGEG